jgi:hypothetical protein
VLSWDGTYAYLRDAGAPRVGGLQLRAGAALVAHVDNMYFLDWDDAHLYWLSSYGVGPAVSLHRTLDGAQTISVEVELPVVGLLGRPPVERFDKVDDLVRIGAWFTKANRDLSVLTGPELAVVDGRLAYQRSPRVRVLYDFGFRATPQPRRAAPLEQAVGVEWSFGGR